ncbi:MAG TPA: thioredoxin domain-containing protein, partial [Thermoleophilia bacterium]|nr:thioredoxin domain-containing protein [Thermoleophilia bacterium]
MANRLIGETSPYLLQHAHNPVDWYPWGEEALAAARSQRRPVFLSIGYAACHWCHVMERESFEDVETAALMNERFINIKVDREERPDLDSIYMRAVTVLTGRGGWPMSVWITPEGAPFFGGTYFPDTPRHDIPSFAQVLEALADAWESRPDEIAASAAKLAGKLREDAGLPVLRRTMDKGDDDARVAAGAASADLVPAPAGLDPETGAEASLALISGFDAANGGWGEAPKFPQPMALEFLLRRWVRHGDEHARILVERSLDFMAVGGIYDQLGGGFHRYSVDAEWLVPHFEKMLYDNSQLARVYTHAWQALGHERYRQVAEETLDYVLREMTHPDGGFFSTQDADSEGVEGKFFVWTPDEIEALLDADAADAGGDAADQCLGATDRHSGEAGIDAARLRRHADAALFMEAYGVEPGGNFEGASILSRVRTDEDLARAEGDSAATVAARLAAARARLLTAREERAHPARDEKILAAWNGLMIAAFADAAAAFGRSDYLLAAERAAAFVLQRLRGPDGRLMRSWRDGSTRHNGYLEDHAHVIEGLLALYQADFDPRWFVAARDLADEMLASFGSAESGFYDTRDDHESLFLRPQDYQDNAVPSGNAMAATVLLKLRAYTGEARYAAPAERTLLGLEPLLSRHPLAFGQGLIAFDLAVGEGGEV